VCRWSSLQSKRQYSKNPSRMDSIGERLDALVRDCDVGVRRGRDPVDFAHRYDREVDREVVGLVAASLAFGNAVAARASIERLLDSLGPHPAETIVVSEYSEIYERLRGFVHRIYRDEHLANLLANAGSILREHGSLGAAFERWHREADGDFRLAMASFADRLRGAGAARSMKHLVSDPLAGSACKRLLLYARWMVRPNDGVDLGLWPLSPAELVMPVDTHVHRISLNLGFTRRKTQSWATAEEITAALRRYDAYDPVKYDFALCHLGVSRECPSRPDLTKCARCVLQDVCSVWETRVSFRS